MRWRPRLPACRRSVVVMIQIGVMSAASDVAMVRRLFGAYRRAVEEFASAAEVCA